jgi:hypothetical protein
VETDLQSVDQNVSSIMTYLKSDKLIGDRET